MRALRSDSCATSSPLMPVMVLLASRMMFWGVELNAKAQRRKGAKDIKIIASLRHCVKLAAIALPVFVVVSTAFYSLAFQRMYANDHPGLEASRWVLTEVPRGSSIVMDNHWDEWLPGLYTYDIWQFPLYEPDTETKMRRLASRLARSDYLIFYSHRPYASAAQDPERFPYSNNYYRLLFSGELGYRLHREFVNYPALGGVVFRDDALARAGLDSPAPEAPSPDANFTLDFGYAEDNVVGYDHPRVLVFRNAARLTELRLREMLAPPFPPPLGGELKGGNRQSHHLPP